MAHHRQKGDVAMNRMTVVTELLGLPHVRVTAYRMVDGSRIELSVESTLEAGVCPTCGTVSQRLHSQGEAQLVRDLPMWQRRCFLRYTPQRFHCVSCQDTFVEQVAWRTAGTSYTVRYEERLYERARREALAQVAQDEGVSEDTVQTIFARWAKKQSAPVAIRL
jgi:transposase